MSFRTYIPRVPLAHWVSRLWLSESDPSPHRQERVLPHGTMQLVISLREKTLRVYDRQRAGKFQTFPPSMLVGAQSEYSIIDTAPQASMIGVAFKPGGAFPFFKCPSNEFQDAHIPMECIWGAAADELRSRLLDAKAARLKFLILEQFLMDHAVRPLELHPAVAFALREFQDVPQLKTISQVADQTDLSPRRFIQVFNESVGLTPKLFCRIRRFQEVLQLINSGQEIDLTEIGLAAGYFDQAHFIHDFQDFSGITPTAYITHRSRNINHIPEF